MKIILQQISVSTLDPIQVIDITADVEHALERAGIRDGLVTLISPHTTAHINLNEREEMLQRDMVKYLGDLVPQRGDYLHNRAPVDGRDNAHAHLMGLFMNATETIPICGGKLMLGGWQSVFFIELDGPRSERRILAQFLGR
jgi:secondary thiamine-phosphate synthase enzyme